ncbi:MAG TPA: nitroreductase family protein [Moorella mulderi]|nr:nitroreductase family protein [Moorella mulderi]
MKDVLRAIRERRSIRRFLPKPVPEDLVVSLVELACWAPSAGNLQPWYFFAVFNRQVKDALGEASADYDLIAQAPVVIVVCADQERSAVVYEERGYHLYCLQDTAAAITLLLLAASAYGLGGCWVGAFDEGMVRRILSLPFNLRPVAMVPLGYPAERPSPPPRRPLPEVLRIIK